MVELQTTGPYLEPTSALYKCPTLKVLILHYMYRLNTPKSLSLLADVERVLFGLQREDVNN